MLTEKDLIFPKATGLATQVEVTVNNLQDLHVESIQGAQSHLKAIKLRKGTSEIKELILCLFVNLKSSRMITTAD